MNDSGTQEILKDLISIVNEQQASISATQENIKTIFKRVDKMYEAIFEGNGQPSIRQMIGSLDEELKDQCEHNKKLEEVICKLDKKITKLHEETNNNSTRKEVAKITSDTTKKVEFYKLIGTALGSGGIVAIATAFLK